jgi:hypothetical protein
MWLSGAFLFTLADRLQYTNPDPDGAVAAEILHLGEQLSRTPANATWQP